jgi:hypothetical protein
MAAGVIHHHCYPSVIAARTSPAISSGRSWKAFVSLEVWMTGRQTVMSWRESSSTAASASGLPNSNYQRHHERRGAGGESVLLGKTVFFYTIVHTDVNEKFCVFGGGHWWGAATKGHEVVAYKSPWQDSSGFEGGKSTRIRGESIGEPTIGHPMARHSDSSHG